MPLVFTGDIVAYIYCDEMQAACHRHPDFDLHRWRNRHLQQLASISMFSQALSGSDISFSLGKHCVAISRWQLRSLFVAAHISHMT